MLGPTRDSKEAEEFEELLDTIDTLQAKNEKLKKKNKKLKEKNRVLRTENEELRKALGYSVQDAFNDLKNGKFNHMIKPQIKRPKPLPRHTKITLGLREKEKREIEAIKNRRRNNDED